MNLEKLKGIINSGLYDEATKEKLILDTLAEDENAIPYIAAMLHYERSSNKLMITEMNVELSRSYAAIDEPHLMKKDFQLGNINSLWERHKPKIGNNFKTK